MCVPLGWSGEPWAGCYPMCFTEVARPAVLNVGRGNCFVWGLGSASCVCSPWVRAGPWFLGLEGFGRVRSAFVPKVNKFLVAHIHIRIDLQSVVRLFILFYFFAMKLSSVQLPNGFLALFSFGSFFIRLSHV